MIREKMPMKMIEMTRENCVTVHRHVKLKSTVHRHFLSLKKFKGVALICLFLNQTPNNNHCK